MDFEEKYKRKVDYNIEYLRGIKGSIKEKFDIKKYKEPDDIIGTKELQGINISMSSDGICGIMKIIEYSKENEIIDNYNLPNRHDALRSAPPSLAPPYIRARRSLKIFSFFLKTGNTEAARRFSVRHYREPNTC